MACGTKGDVIVSKYKSEYSQWFWSECDELNSDTSFANRLAEKAWNHKQAEIDEYKEVVESMEDAYLREKAKVDELRKRIDLAIDAVWNDKCSHTVIDILKGTTNEQ